MPYTTNPAPCKVCGVCGKETRIKYHHVNNRYYLQSTCKECERARFAQYQKENKDNFSKYNKKIIYKKARSAEKKYAAYS